MDKGENTQRLIDHLFRHEAGKMIAVLTRIFGIHNLEMAEDTVQETFIKALQVWRYNQLPDNPAAWLMQVARNKALDIVRRQQRMTNISRELAYQLHTDTEKAIEHFFLDSEIADSQLRLIFACCHPALNPEDQVALTLKTISGFSVKEIARALISTESAIQKRIYRAREYLKEKHIELEIPVGTSLQERLSSVHMVLYLLFNEGYNSMKEDELIRHDLCAEAMRLCNILSTHQMGGTPSTYALMALMCFQASRFESRIGEDQNIILLQDQDRSKWDKELIQLGIYFLQLSAGGDLLSVYHLESAIAAEHCLAPDYASTNWGSLLKLYDNLLIMKPSPAVQLNRAVLLSHLEDITTAIDAILEIPGIEGLVKHHHIYGSVLGDLYLRAGNLEEAWRHLLNAQGLTPSQAEKKLLQTKLDRIASRRKV